MNPVLMRLYLPLMNAWKTWGVMWGMLCLVGSPAFGQWTMLSAYSSQDIQAYAQTNLGFDEVTLSMLTRDVSMRRLSYDMPFLGEEIQVSGAVFIPDAPNEALPVLVHHHGTTFKRQAAPSFKDDLSNLGFAMASLGFLVLMPDYVGLGESSLPHPYCHAESEAEAGWSMVERVAELVWDLDVSLNGNLYLMGYSQGGHGAMAMAQAGAPESLEGELSLKAAAPLSGPYDMLGRQLPWILDSPNYSQPSYIFYLMQGWNSVYGTLFESFSDVCVAPYDGLLNDMLDGEHSGEAINDICPEDWTTMLLPGVLEAMTEPGSPLLVAAEANDVHDWSPAMPIHMRYCTEDEEVVFTNATSAFEAMTAAGAPNVQAYNLGAYSHNDCALSAIASSVLWFLSLEANTSGVAHLQASPCSDWETFDALGRHCPSTEGAQGLHFKRCLQTGRVEKWLECR